MGLSHATKVKLAKQVVLTLMTNILVKKMLFLHWMIIVLENSNKFQLILIINIYRKLSKIKLMKSVLQILVF